MACLRIGEAYRGWGRGSGKGKRKGGRGGLMVGDGEYRQTPYQTFLPGLLFSGLPIFSRLQYYLYRD